MWDVFPDIPITISIPVVVASEVLLPGCNIRLDLERLINASKEIIRVVRANIHQCGNVLFYLRWGEPAHEVEHRVQRISHVGIVVVGQSEGTGWSLNAKKPLVPVALERTQLSVNES